MPRVFRAPGRVNLIGDHTDYNEGFVMPIAIQLETHVRITARADHTLRLSSSGSDAPVRVDLSQPLVPRGTWSDYIVGVAKVLQDEGRRVQGAELIVSSTVPQGAGLSSSAALEVATAFALLDGDIPDRVTVARWCQQAENEFVGARCGIMDQYVACMGQRGHAIVIDCRTLDSRAVRVPSDVTILVSNTMVKHSIAGGEYNQRRAQCEEAVQRLRAALPSIHSLRDVTHEDLDAHAGLLPEETLRRARHVVSENARVGNAADGLARGDFAAVGALMRESHRSLRDDFAVSAPELDLMVELADALPGVYGSRMTGGGFGGSTVTLVDAAAAADAAHAIHRGYLERTGRTPEVIACTPSAGAGELA